MSELPVFEASTLRINGTFSDWYRPIEDSVYDYLLTRWNTNDPAKEDLHPANISYQDVGWAHFWVQRGQTNIKRADLAAQIWNAQTNLNINMLMKREGSGQVANTLSNMLNEVKRGLIEYRMHWIAGIIGFNDFNEVPLVYGPDDERNPWQTTWVAMITVNAHYIISTAFNQSSEPYNPAQWSAGQLTFLE